VVPHSHLIITDLSFRGLLPDVFRDETDIDINLISASSARSHLPIRRCRLYYYLTYNTDLLNTVLDVLYSVATLQRVRQTVLEATTTTPATILTRTTTLAFARLFFPRVRGCCCLGTRGYRAYITTLYLPPRAKGVLRYGYIF